MSNLLTVIITLLELAPESGKWVVERMLWSLTSQITSLTGDLRGARNPADWVEAQRAGLLRLLGRLLELSGNHVDVAINSVEGHMQYLENKENKNLVVEDDRLELMRAAGASEDVIRQYVSDKTAKNRLKIVIKQRAIELNRNAFKAEVESLIQGCMSQPLHEKEISVLTIGTQKYLANGLQTQLDARVAWLMDNVMTESGELTVLNVFMNKRYSLDLIHALEETTEQTARAGYERTEEVG